MLSFQSEGPRNTQEENRQNVSNWVADLDDSPISPTMAGSPYSRSEGAGYVSSYEGTPTSSSQPELRQQTYWPAAASSRTSSISMTRVQTPPPESSMHAHDRLETSRMNLTHHLLKQQQAVEADPNGITQDFSTFARQTYQEPSTALSDAERQTWNEYSFPSINSAPQLFQYMSGCYPRRPSRSARTPISLPFTPVPMNGHSIYSQGGTAYSTLESFGSNSSIRSGPSSHMPGERSQKAPSPVAINVEILTTPARTPLSPLHVLEVASKPIPDGKAPEVVSSGTQEDDDEEDAEGELDDEEEYDNPIAVVNAPSPVSAPRQPISIYTDRIRITRSYRSSPYELPFEQGHIRKSSRDLSSSSLNNVVKHVEPSIKPKPQTSGDVVSNPLGGGRGYVRGETKDDPAKPHKCEVCERGFARYYNLKAHMKTHDPERKLAFICPYAPRCAKAFSRLHDLERHRMTIHTEGPLWEAKALDISPALARAQERARIYEKTNNSNTRALIGDRNL